MKILIEALLVVLFIQGSSAETSTERSALVGTDVTLSCVFDKLSKRVEWNSLTVEWYMVDKQSVKRPVYMFVDGRAHMNRAGSVVDEVQLLHSDASLKLCNVTVGDEGLYTCRIITPVVYTETASLQVRARPSVSLPQKIALTEGQEKTIQCNITGYYPDQLDVTWHIQNSSNIIPAAANQLLSVCTNMAKHNPDGTYSIRSGITLHSSAVKGGEMLLICRVEHLTYSQPYDRSVRLTVQAPPNVSLITPNIVHANKPTRLQCVIRGETRRALRVKWIQSRTTAGSNDWLESDSLFSGDEDLSHTASLETDGKKHIAVLPVCLSIKEDKNKYQCVVQCRGKTISREVTVQVQVEPTLLQISSIPQIPRVEKRLVLCCRVENFYPPDVDLVWFRSDGEQVRTFPYFGPFSAQNHLYSVWSKMELLMATEDENVCYTCRVYHTSFSERGYKDVSYNINTQGSAPELTYIKCEPNVPLLNKECTLHLFIEDFCPEGVTVTWTKNGEELLSGVFNTPPSLSINGCYSMFSFLKFIPTEEDQGAKFTCKVIHSAQKEPGEERSYVLKALQVPNGC
ncbi:uncharacterized protein LOC117816986 [Xyrichtys novacula]|uniref:Uncharacterized protein LOC117816986 n=1 Tax=Xyrichtys novacula TaxID=13765 RepID=A0AAV1ETF3_XYRNO|nr:uncharacterized protein LOC117816986 [Xyrichtys novacula]